MWRSFAIILMTLPAFNAYGQDFLREDDSYIYGIGVADTQSQADEEALLSFSRKLQTKVTSVVTYNVSEEDGNVEESFQKSIKIDNSVIINNVEQIVRFENGCYTVYRYVNRHQYCNERMNIYRSYLEKIPKYEQSDYAHKINFILGAYYLAYKAIDDVLMDIINPNNNSLKDFLFEKAKDAYGSILPRLEFIENDWELIGANIGLPLYGFQYLTRTGLWKIPEIFFGHYRDKTTATSVPKNNNYKYFMVRYGNINLETRLTYEVLTEDNGIIVLNVPNNWYFYKKRSL